MQVHLVDGTYELFRAYYGAPKKTGHDGQEVGATLGLARSLTALIEKEGATHIGVAFDHVIESFRNDLFDGYKTGDGIEPELFDQFPLAETLTEALGLTTWPMVEFEADDAIATMASRLSDANDVAQILICSPDKDFAQCVRDNRTVLVDRRRKKVIGSEGVLEKFGVPPESIPDWLALVGDRADGIPGIPRWGARSAASALKVYGTIERIPTDHRTWDFQVRGASTLSDMLNQGREDARLYRKLATLRTDVPLQSTLEDLRWKGADQGKLSTMARKLGAGEWLTKIVALKSR